MANEDQASAAEKDFSAQFLANRKRRNRRRWIAGLAVVVVASGLYYWQTQQGTRDQEAEALIVTIGYGDIENAIPASGSLQPRDIVPVGARASGQLEEILVEVGDVVEEDQLLARIDAEEQQLRVEQSELNLESQVAQVEQRESQLKLAEADYRRTLALHEADAASDQELQNAENSLISARTSLTQLEKSIEQNRKSLEQEGVQLNYTNIYAPLAGTIISLDQKEGATLNASQTAPTVMQIADLSTLTVEVQISEADISQIELGTRAYFTTLGGGDRRWYGELRQIESIPDTSNNVVLYTGRFDVDNSERELYVGMTTQVFFVTSSAEDVLTVPRGALTFTDEPAAGGAPMSRAGSEGGPNREELAARFEEFRASGGEIPPEMRQRIEQMREQGGFDGGGFPGGGGFQGGGRGFGGGGAGGAGGGRLNNSIALNEPRNATVELVQDDGTTVVREVVVGIQDSVNAEVISGLDEGDRVIAGIVEPELEEDNNNNNNDRGWRGPPRGFF